MQKLDEQIKEVNEWIDGAEIKMDEIDSQGPKDAVLKVTHYVPLSYTPCIWFCLSLISFQNFTIL